MKIISTTKALLVNDRSGKVEEFIQIRIKQTDRNSETREYAFETKDILVLNKGTENESFQIHKDRHGQPCVYNAKKTFAEFKAQKKALLLLYPTTLTGDDLDDYVLQLILLDDVTKSSYYGVTFEKM